MFDSDGGGVPGGQGGPRNNHKNASQSTTGGILHNANNSGSAQYFGNFNMAGGGSSGSYIPGPSYFEDQ